MKCDLIYNTNGNYNWNFQETSIIHVYKLILWRSCEHQIQAAHLCIIPRWCSKLHLFKMKFNHFGGFMFECCFFIFRKCVIFPAIFLKGRNFDSECHMRFLNLEELPSWTKFLNFYINHYNQIYGYILQLGGVPLKRLATLKIYWRLVMLNSRALKYI